VSTGPGRTSVSIAPAHLDDLPAIMALERAGFAESEQWSERSWLGELIADNRRVLLARATQLVGVITLSVTGELAELLRLVVAPAHLRTDIGTQLVHAGLEAVRRAGARAAILEVGYTNEAAIALYQRLGFEQLRVRESYYGPGRHALILKRYDL
jgi:[ribosomal protein S18]-alanine N-acetyltransferase